MELREFKEFLLLEKIEKREFAKVFADDTIRVGIEFECYIDGLSQAGSGLDKVASDDYFEFITKAERHIRQLEKAQVSWREDMEENIAQAAKMRQKQLDAMQVKLEAMKDQESPEYEELENKISTLQGEIDEIEALDYYDLDGNDFDIDFENEFEYIDNNVAAQPTPSNAVYEYLYEYLNIDENGFDNMVRDAIFAIVYEGENNTVRGYLEQVSNIYIHFDGAEGSTTVEDLEEFDWSIFPFNDYVIGDYHGNDKNFHQWRIELDESTGDNGVEIISPIMKLQDALPVMKTMFAFINRYGGTTKDHGMHVNISKKGAGTDNVDLLKLMLFVDEGFVWKKFPDRKGNSYSKSVFDELVSKTRLSNSDIKRDIEKIHNSAQVIFPAFKSKLNLPKEKFKGVNFSNLHAGSGRIEMRYLGGADYHRKYKDNVAAIGRYVYYLLLSLDPDFKKKEYAKKLLRLSNTLGGKNTDKISKREYDKVLQFGNRVGYVSGSNYKEYYQYEKLVYEISNNEIVNRYSLKNWKSVISKLRNYKSEA